MLWFHGKPTDCPTPKMVADLTLTGGGNHEPTGAMHAECPGHCQHVWVAEFYVDAEVHWRDICRDCGVER